MEPIDVEGEGQISLGRRKRGREKHTVQTVLASDGSSGNSTIDSDSFWSGQDWSGVRNDFELGGEERLQGGGRVGPGGFRPGKDEGDEGEDESGR